MSDENKVIESRFKILNIIGRGGMGNVYHVADSSGKEYALKTLITGLKNSAATPELFRREFDLLSKLKHPNIIEVYEIVEEDEVSFYTMEYLPGKSLKDWVSGKENIDEATSLNILLELARALNHVHQNGIIHHDVHPMNVQLISKDNKLTVKLLDFGISLLKEDQKKEEIKVGMLNYKSPEHSRGDLLNDTADIYCFGAIAYEVFTGKQPFSLIEKGLERNPLGAYAAMAMHALKEVPTIKGLKSKISYEVNRMVQICMEKEPEYRYQSMQEVIERLEDTLKKL